MSKVFITKYPTSVNNDKLPIYGKIRIGINVSSPANIGTFQINEPIDAIGGNFLQKDLSTVIGSHVDKYNSELYVDSNVSEILINKYGLDGQLYLSNSNNIYDVDISEFRYSKLLVFQILGKGITGDISSLSSMSRLTSLNVKNTNVTGDISSLSSMSQLKGIDLSNSTNVTGDISSLSSMSRLTGINLSDNKNVTGDISSLSSMSQLISLNVQNTNVTGDISSLSSMRQLATLNLSYNLGIKGDISSLSSMSQLTSLKLAGTGVTGDISSIVNNLTALKALEIPPTITITDEQKTTLTNRGCTVTIR